MFCLVAVEKRSVSEDVNATGRETSLIPKAPPAFLAAALLFTLAPQWSRFGLENVELSSGIHLAATAFVLGLYTMWVERTIVHPLLFLLVTTSLFIGGRFIAALLAIDAPVFSDGHFVPFTLTDVESAALTASISAALLGIWGGYYLLRHLLASGTISVPNDQAHPYVIPLVVLLLFVGIAGTVFAGFDLAAACRADGYLGIFKSHGMDNLTRIGLLSQYILLLASGLAFASGNRALRVIAVCATGAYFLLYFAFGVRSGFIGFVFLLIWLFVGNLRAWRLLALPFIFFCVFMAAQFVISFGCRGDATRESVEKSNDSVEQLKGNDFLDQKKSNDFVAEIKNNETVDKKGSNDSVYQINNLIERVGLSGARSFAYLQGSTLVYVGMARRLENYPATALVGSLIPGFGLFARTVDPSLRNQDILLPHYLAASYSPKLYSEGYGIGWSLFADFHVYSGGSPFIFVTLGGLFGALLCYLVVGGRKSAFLNGALIAIFIKLMILPRTGLYSIAPYMIAYMSLLIGCYFVDRVWRKVNDSAAQF